MKQLLIGDIHGCFSELQELICKAGITDKDQVIALGDIVDRGPDSVDVVDFFRATPNAVCVQGNHERKHVRSYRGEIKPALSQRITRHQFGEARYPEACEWMDTLPLSIELPNALLVHGMFEPGIPLDQQRDTTLAGTLTAELYLKKKYDVPWYDLYDGSKLLVVGHHHYLGKGEPLVRNDRVFAIDTGCCRGHTLTGLLLPEFSFISVRSRANYWQQAERENQHLRLAPRAQRLLREIYNHVLAQHQDLVDELREEGDFDCLNSKQQFSEYSAKASRLPQAKLMHLAQKGILSMGRIYAHLKNAASIERLADEIGVS